MNFQIAKIGHSFKGSMAYYLHDKRQAGEQFATTDERVAWTETRNLATDGPHTATRIMIATAESADALKEAAGVKTTGRKATAGPVLAFSLQWEPHELPGRDRAEMVRAADHALKVLKLDHLQAVLVCHQDTAHPHVHVVVNRIDPENGKATPIRAPDVKALDRWANQYEHERGQVVSPNRAEKYAEQERKRRQHPDAEKRKAHMEQRNAELAARRKERLRRPAVDLARAADPQPKPIDKTPAGMLKELGDAQKARHRQEWAQLAADQKKRRQAVYDLAGRHIRAELDRAKTDNRPLWSELHRDQREKWRAFEEREKTLAGKVRNCIAAAKLQERHGEPSARGFLSMAFAYVGNRDARRQAFTADQAQQRQRFAAELKARTDAQIAHVKQLRSQTLEKARGIMTAERGALIERQNSERAKVREAWRQLNLQRGRMPARAQPEKPTMRDFDEAVRRLSSTGPQMIKTTPQAIATPAPAPAPAGMPQPPARTVRDVPRVDQAAEWAKTDQGRAEMAKHQPAPAARPQFDQARQSSPAKLEHSKESREALNKIAAEHGFSARAIAMKDDAANWQKVFGAKLPTVSIDAPSTAFHILRSPSPAPTQAPATQQPAASQESRADFWDKQLKAKADEMSRDGSRDRSQTRQQDKDQEPKM